VAKLKLRENEKLKRAGNLDTLFFVKVACHGTLILMSKNLHFESLTGRDGLEGSLRKVLIIALFYSCVLRNVPDSDRTVCLFIHPFAKLVTFDEFKIYIHQAGLTYFGKKFM
jgi:hypothetical protein